MTRLPSYAQLSKPEDIDLVIGQMNLHGEGFRTPLFRAARDRQLGLLMVTGGGLIPRRNLKATAPHVVLLCGDDPADPGPSGWPQATALIDWGVSAVIHATGGQAAHYEAIKVIALLHRRVLVIETEYRHHAAWLAMISKRRPNMPVLNIVPPAGGQHPAAPRPGEVH